ncbi:MAG: hypothetical protein M0Q53_04655 [Prolixibacteraceae bacterium]|jgi:hypothetical protein|nr:hypothetical protein [Prolixibacteraceae bacterium]
MQITLKRQFLFFVLLATSFPSLAGDSLYVNTFNTFRLLKMVNGWLETGNMAGLVLNQQNKSWKIETGYDNSNGQFHLIRDGENVNDYSLSTESFQTLGKRIFLYGKFACHSLDETGGQWNGTYDPYNGNPYILSDSLSGTTYHKENYNLAGGIGFSLNDRISLGAGLDYYIGVAAKQKDPRPKNIYIRFKVNPALIFTTSKYKLGIDIGYKIKIEEIDYNVLRSNFLPSYFAYKGLGFFDRIVDTRYYRFLTAHEFLGGVQFEKKRGNIPSLTELRFNYDVEGIEDGITEIRKKDGGEWRTYQVVLTEQVCIQNGLSHYRITGGFTFFNGDGNEFLQNLVNSGQFNTPTYVTIGENLKFNRQTFRGQISCNYLKHKDQGRIDWDATVGVNYLNNREQYFYIPELFGAGYSNITGNLFIQKNLYFGKCHLALSLNLGYTSDLSKDLQLSSLPEITKKQRQDVYLQEFDYYTSNVLKSGGEVKIGRKFMATHQPAQVYLSLCCDRLNQLNEGRSFNYFGAKIGMVF